MSFYLESKQKKDCFNCSACATVCPKQCITMKQDPANGYIYPVVDEEKCIHCGKCKKVCINENQTSLQNDIKKAYVLYNKNEEVRKRSSSGGISSLLMEYVLKQNGVIYGAKYNDKLIVEHARATTMEECDKFKTSKYVRSNILGIYTQVLEDLQKGKLVLFTGTPCQIAGIKSITSPKLQENLILCEIMCDCVASPLLFRKLIEHIEKKYKKKVKNFNFRCKINGANHKSAEIEFIEDTQKVILPIEEYNEYSEYMQMFGCGLSAPESCTNCEFEHTNERVSDFTIGDYWGKKEILKEDDKGMSFILLNTEKAVSIFTQEIKEQVECKEVQILEALDRNHLGHKGTILNKEEFERDLPVLSFEELAKKYVRKYRWRTKLGKLIPKELKEKIKKRDKTC